MIEMLISLSIFAVVTAFVTANFRAGRQSDELRLSTQLVATAIRRAQTMAISGQTVPACQGGSNDKGICPGGTNPECPGGICVKDVQKGYGIHLTTTGAGASKAVLFADTDGDKAFSVRETVRTDSITPGPFVVASGLNPITAGSALDIVFEPPKPKTWFNGSQSTGIATITLRHTTTGQTRNVTINLISGQINAD
ncbi:MAG TPA: type II secretion system protein [Candidatus Binatia bacterium]|jgi:Tfp pilus assembly protein FimT|nr:type II secretion system protein [Candidatus Binatia bacterium]